MKLILISGLPGSGKSTLAGIVSQRMHLPLLSKDAIKEPLMDSLASAEISSRLLSNASFAVLFQLAHTLTRSGSSILLEGNFRPAEHLHPVSALLSSSPDSQLIQVLCRIDEAERQRRLHHRHSAGLRHPGHQELGPTEMADLTADGFLELPGDRLIYTGDHMLEELVTNLQDRVGRAQTPRPTR